MSGSSDSSDDPKIEPRAVRLGQVWEAANMLSAAQVSKHVSGNTRHSANGYGSVAPLRDRFLHADVPPPSHPRSRSRLVVACCLVGLILAIAISSVIVFGQLRLADIWHQPTDDHLWTRLNWATSALRGEQAIPRLIVQSSRGTSGEPIPLGLAISGPAEGAVVIITGLLARMEVSTGVEVGAHRWELLPEDVGYAFIAPPENFVGSADLVAELRLADDKIVDRQAIYLEWLPPSSPALASERDLEKVAAASSPSLAPEPVDRHELTVSLSPLALASERDLEKAAATSSPSLAPESVNRHEVTASPSPPALASERDLEKVAAASSPSLAPEPVNRQEVTVSPSPLALASERDLEKAAAASSPSLAPEPVDRQEVTVSSSPPVLASERDLEKAAAMPSSPSLAPEPVNRQEVTVSPSPLALASERDLEKAAAIPNSPSLAPEPVDRQEVTVSSSPPVLASERDLEKTAAIPSSPSLALEPVDRQEVTVSSSPPVLASERDLEKAAAMPSSPSLAPEPVDRQEVTVSSSPPVLASERDLEKAAVIPGSPSLAQSQSGREEAVVPPNFPRIAQKQADQEQPLAGSSIPTFAKRQLDREEITVLLKVGKDLIASGDIAAARLTLKRAADAGDAEAALALASTYDPYVLRELKVYGFPADAAMARAWYEKAKDLGSPVAPRRLEMLARGAR